MAQNMEQASVEKPNVRVINYVTLLQTHVLTEADIPSDIVDQVKQWFVYLGGVEPVTPAPAAEATAPVVDATKEVK